MAYEIMFKSKDNQKYSYTTNIGIELEAIKSAENKIIENGWDYFQYNIESINKIKGMKNDENKYKRV